MQAGVGPAADEKKTFPEEGRENVAEVRHILNEPILKRPVEHGLDGYGSRWRLFWHLEPTLYESHTHYKQDHQGKLNAQTALDSK